MEGLTDIQSSLSAELPTTTGNDPMLSSSAADLNTAASALSRSPVAPVSLSGIVDSSEFRSQVPEPTYHTLNGRMTPNGGPLPAQAAHVPTGFAVTYATLTPLQPLPPISTVTPSEKFPNVSCSGVLVGQTIPNPSATPSGFAAFSVQPSDIPNSLSSFAVPAVNAYNVNIKYEYDIKPPPGLTPGSSTPQNGGTQTCGSGGVTMATTSTSCNSQYTNMPAVIPVTMHPQQAFSNYCGSPYNTAQSTHTEHHRSPKQEPKTFAGNGFDSAPHPYSSPGNMGPSGPSPLPGGGPMVSGGGLMNGLGPCGSPPLSVGPLTPQQSHSDQASLAMPLINHHQTPPHATALTLRKHPSKSTPQHHLSNHHPNNSTPGPPLATAPASSGELEEINTKELAQRISAELKRYSIPQAIFAQRVLCRSQGTLSDLLRNPKPWSKLKSGRETFRRMLKWLEEPEFQRMSALRLAEIMEMWSLGVQTFLILLAIAQVLALCGCRKKKKKKDLDVDCTCPGSSCPAHPHPPPPPPPPPQKLPPTEPQPPPPSSTKEEEKAEEENSIKGELKSLDSSVSEEGETLYEETSSKSNPSTEKTQDVTTTSMQKL